SPQSNGSLGAQLVHGQGVTLDDQSTLSATSRQLTADERRLATLAGNLTSTSGMDASSLLKHFGISFVLLETGAGEGLSPASATQLRAETALDSNPLLTQVASTDDSVLWSVPAQTHSVPIPPDAGGWERLVALIALGVVFGLTLLLALPTGRTERGTLRRPTAAEVLGRQAKRRGAAKGDAGGAPPSPEDPTGPIPEDGGAGGEAADDGAEESAEAADASAESSETSADAGELDAERGEASDGTSDEDGSERVNGEIEEITVERPPALTGPHASTAPSGAHGFEGGRDVH
ncbi:MAG: hypothetical protein ACTHNX_10805, partial [Humibacter sp.]